MADTYIARAVADVLTTYAQFDGYRNFITVNAILGFPTIKLKLLIAIRSSDKLCPELQVSAINRPSTILFLIPCSSINPAFGKAMWSIRDYLTVIMLSFNLDLIYYLLIKGAICLNCILLIM